jgi:hypothetical protein
MMMLAKRNGTYAIAATAAAQVYIGNLPSPVSRAWLWGNGSKLAMISIEIAKGANS